MKNRKQRQFENRWELQLIWAMAKKLSDYNKVYLKITFCTDKEAWRNNRVNRNRINARIRKVNGKTIVIEGTIYPAKIGNITLCRRLRKKLNKFIKDTMNGKTTKEKMKLLFEISHL